MGWKENGKYGVSTGRTVRSPFANAGGPFSCSFPGREMEYLLKFTRGTETLSSTELDEFLSVNDIDDGLGDFAESSMRRLTAGSNVHLSSISYSLKKRKRWRLPDLDRTGGLELKDSADRPNVTFIHRRVEKTLDADCFAIEKTKENEVFTPRKRKYTRVQDLLKRCDASEVEPEVGYEISYRYPANEYPECSEGHGHRYRWSFQWSLSNPRKSRFKNKGVKNKGHRWDLYSDSEIRKKKIAREEPCICEVISYKANVESNVKMMDAELFRELKTSEERFCSSGATDFDLGCYIEELCKHTGNHPNCKKTNQRLSAACSNQDQSIKNSFKYGKKSAIYNDLKPASIDLSQNQDIANSSPSAKLEPQVFQPEKKAAVTLLLNADEVKPGNLKAEWHDLYTEANSLPRKFTIDLMPLFSTDHSITSESYCLLFEVAKKNRNWLSAAHVTTDVSLHCTKTEDFTADSNSCDANAKFCSEMEGASQGAWQVSNVVDCAVFSLQNCFHSPQYPTCRYNSGKLKTWKSVEVLGDMFGWKSEICTQREVKSELKMKIKEQSLRWVIDEIHTCTEMVGLSGEILDTFCGICYKDLDTCDGTALKHCRHVFCNECWEVHLKMRISLGNTDLKCPGYKCDVCVDDVTILALVPSWYNKFLAQKIDKALDTSPKLRWCPTTKCGRVLKVAVFGAMANIRSSPMPVACECGEVWCFQCGRQAHWPASCSADEKFHEVTKRFLGELELNEDELITSVMVRNCPHCHYPIEKHLGCNFMYCIMCQTSFCWECLMPMSKHKDGCQRHEQSKEVELELASSSANRFAKYFSVYCDSKKARSSIALSHQIQRLRTVEKSIACYKSICSSHGYSDDVMENVLQSGCSEILRSAAEFTYYAHLTLEGAAKMAIVSKSTCRSLKQDMERLQFIMEKIEELAKCDITQLLRQKCLSKLAAFLNCGKNCVFTIGQVLATRH